MIEQKSILDHIANFIEKIGSGHDAQARRIAKHDLDMQFYQNGHARAPINPVAAQHNQLEHAFRKPSREHYETRLADQADHAPRKTKTVFVSGSAMRVAA